MNKIGDGIDLNKVRNAALLRSGTGVQVSDTTEASMLIQKLVPQKLFLN
jgi:hypothetical protein